MMNRKRIESEQNAALSEHDELFEVHARAIEAASDMAQHVHDDIINTNNVIAVAAEAYNQAFIAMADVIDFTLLVVERLAARSGYTLDDLVSSEELAEHIGKHELISGIENMLREEGDKE